MWILGCGCYNRIRDLGDQFLKRWLFIAAPLLLTFACQDRDVSLTKSYMKRPAAGMVDGQSWEVKYAYIDPTAETPKEDDFAFILLDYKPSRPCPKISSIPSEARTMIISGPKAKTKRSVKLKAGTARTLVMQWTDDEEPQALIAKKGRFKVLSTDADEVKGKLMARYDSDNWINGYFSADVCAYRDMQDFSEDVFD